MKKTFKKRYRVILQVMQPITLVHGAKKFTPVAHTSHFIFFVYVEIFCLWEYCMFKLRKQIHVEY